ncbi:unnamed protein product [Phytophthora fragariaefolia]|uniref:Unnamed protein product n=1 Tax=Phytophthora fragariaefolia TaxID=1490495 RepID=A0A9W6XF87_9STRA|nr:unnamed protein product [Phytophthora fragariaefolia]
MADRTRQAVFGSADIQHHGVGRAEKQRLPVGAGRAAGRPRSSLRKETHSPPPLKEQVPETPLMCLSVSMARNSAFHAGGLEASHELSNIDFLESLKAEELEEVVLVRAEHCSGELNSSSVMAPEVLEDERTSRRKMRYDSAILQDPSDPYYGLLKELSDVVNDDPLSVHPPDRGVRHEMVLVPGTKYSKHAAGMARESKSPHSSPTFCVRKPTGKWRMMHAFNKLNVATIPASTPIPRKDVLQNNMAGCTVFSALDMVDREYQLLMRESDIPLTAVRALLTPRLRVGTLGLPRVTAL